MAMMRTRKAFGKVTFFLFMCVYVFFVPKFAAAQVVINEFSPFTATEWVEFYNASNSAEYIKNYYIDDDTSFESDDGNKSKKLLVDLIINTNTYPIFETKSFFNNDKKESVVLFNNNGEIIDQFQYWLVSGEKTFGRSPDQTGSFYLLTSATKEYANTAPVPSPSSSPTLTPSPTTKPSPVPTPVATLQPSSSAKSSPKLSVLPKRESPEPTQVLGIMNIGASASPSLKSSTTSQSDSHTNSSPILGVILVVIGLVFSGVSGFVLYRLKETGKLI